MSVEAFTVDGKVTIDTTKFESGIKKVANKLKTLNESLKAVMEMGGGNWNFNGALKGLKSLKDDITVVKEEIASMNTEFKNTQGINALKSQIASLREEIEKIKQKVNEVGTVAQETATKVGNTISTIASKTNETASATDRWVSALRVADSSMVNPMSVMSETVKQTIRLKNGVQGVNVTIDEMTGKMVRITTFSKDIGNYFMNEEKWLKQNVALLEREATLTQQRANALAKIGRELVNQGNQIKRNLTFEEEMVATERLFQNAIGEEIAEKFRLNAEIEETNRLYMQNLEIEKASANLEKEMVTFLNEENGLIQKITGSHEKSMATIKEELTLEKEKIGLIEEETALLNEQGAVRQKNAVSGANANKLDKMGNLPRRIGSMALTMWGYNEIMDVYGKTMSHIDAMAQRDYFAKRIGMDQKALVSFNSSLVEMQKDYQKLDMTVVGANALETASKYKVQSDSVDELTEVMAIYGSEFVKQGRTQEESILAVNDALDGELRRLKEVGIGAEELEATGLWNGDASDKSGMILALQKIAEDRGYDKTAKAVVTLSDAITQLEVKISIDLARAFKTVEPLLRDVMKNFIFLLGLLERAIGFVVPKITGFAKAIGLIDKNGDATKFGNYLESWASWMITFGITAFGVYKIVKPLYGWLKNLRGVTDGMAKTTGDISGDVGKTMNTGGFKENFKSEWGKLGKNLGKMARVFVEFAVALFMAWALIEEAIILISTIGATYNALKPQFNQGIEFIKEFGIWFALVGGVMIGFSYALNRWGDGAMEGIGNGAKALGKGIAIAMLLVAETIAMLIAPMVAIAMLGGTASFLGTNLDKGIEVITWISDALHKIDLPIALFIGGFIAISLLLGLVQPLTLALGLGIASTLLLVTEAIAMLIPPLGAIALLGGTASVLGESNIQKGAEAIELIGKCLQILAQAVPNLLVVDLGVFAYQLVDWGNKLMSGGKDGLTTLVEDILPTLLDFVKKFNELDTSDPIDSTKVEAITQMATDIPPLFDAMTKLNQALGTSDVVGNIGGAITGSLNSELGTGLKGKLDQLYNDVKDVFNFATKLGGLQGDNGADVSALTQTTNAIALLKAKLDLLVTTISTASTRVKTASKSLGSAIKIGFNEGVSGFNTSVVSVIASGIKEVQSRYDTWHNGGETSAKELARGFETISDKFKTTISTEMGYALTELDNYKDDFYNKGAMLGQSLVDGFKSSDGLDFNSPALISRTIAKEMEYSMLALDKGRQMMYQGGVALGSALVNGYQSYGNLRTDVGILASKGVTNEQLQANAKNVQVNAKKNQEVPQSFNPTINIDMSNSTVIGVTDLDAKIKSAVEKAIVSINTPNGAIGY